MKIVGELPVIRLTAVVLQGATDNKVRVLGPKGGGNRASSQLRAKRTRRGRPSAHRVGARIPKVRAA